MNGNKNLPAGCEEEMVGHNAIAAGFQGLIMTIILTTNSQSLALCSRER